MVFFGRMRSDLHVHEPGKYMKISLYILAAGTLISWLSFGSFSNILAETLPNHTIFTESTGHLVSTIFKDPLTYLAILMVLIGILIWVFHKPFSQKLVIPKLLETGAVNSFGFESINNKVVKDIQNLSEYSRGLQTGILNWNIFGVLSGLVLILVILGIGG